MVFVMKCGLFKLVLIISLKSWEEKLVHYGNCLIRTGSMAFLSITGVFFHMT